MSLVQVLLSSHAVLADGSYLEPRSGTVVTVDHIAGAVTGSRPAQPGELAPAAVEPFRAAVEAALQGYVGETYSPHGTCAVYGREGSAAGAVEVTVCLASAKANLRNFWSGRLGSCWQACYDAKDGGESTLSGQLEVAVHYCEDGNVQLRAKHSASARVRAHDAASFGAAVAGAIKRAEAQYYAALEVRQAICGLCAE